jgi:hypothetical protein
MRALPVMRAASSIVLACALAAIAVRSLTAQDVSGRWVYEESGQTAELDIRHDRATGRVSGTFSLLGQSAPIAGRFLADSFVVERFGGIPTSPQSGTMAGLLRGETLLLTVAQPGQAPMTIPMTRRGKASDVDVGDAEGADTSRRAPAAAPSAGDAGGGSATTSASDIAGRWEARSDDGTSEEVVELAVAGGSVTGSFTGFEHGYFSQRTTVKQKLALRGTLRDGVAHLRVWDPGGSASDAAEATARRRGEYLVLRTGDEESGYARPGTPLVRPGQGAEATALARAVSGRVYSTKQEAGGRGAYLGGRVKLALCADGRVEYDASDLAATPGPLGGGADLGGTVSRRGVWDVVLVAGAPAVRARWEGTGSSYSLTAYFSVAPDAGGRSATVNGTKLPVAGRC